MLRFHVNISSWPDLVNDVKSIHAVTHQDQKLMWEYEWNIISILFISFFEVLPLFFVEVGVGQNVLMPFLEQDVTD